MCIYLLKIESKTRHMHACEERERECVCNIWLTVAIASTQPFQYDKLAIDLMIRFHFPSDISIQFKRIARALRQKQP